MNHSSIVTSSNSTLTTTVSSTLETVLSTTLQTVVSTTTSSMSINETIFKLISKILNGSDLYQHQVADLIEPEKYSVGRIHVVIWTISIFTYLLAIPIAIRMVRSRAYLNITDYFSGHIILCAFVAWIPAFILLLYHWFKTFTLRLCRLHYVILSTNETVPLFFVLYMIIERFLYAHPSIKQKYKRFSNMIFIHLYAIFTWLIIMLIYAVSSPFKQRDLDPTLSIITNNFCPYNFPKLRIIATGRSIIYFCLLFPALILIGFVLRYFFLMRGTSQVPPIEKLWTIRVTALLCILVFYDIYLYYLEHIAETFNSFLLASLLRSTFYLIQLFIIACTEPYWLEILIERCACLCCMITGQRRKATTPVAIPTDLEVNSAPYSASTGHYSLVDDDNIDDQFDRAINEPEPTLRVIA